MDAEEYVAKCPTRTSNWTISHLCQKSPASFVYEGSKISNEIKRYLEFLYPQYNVYSGIYFDQYTAVRKFRNHYCATCNDPGWLACRMETQFKIWDEETERWLRHFPGPSKYAFVFRIDVDRRTCERDSDSYLTYGDTTTGYDTCLKVAEELWKCDCSSVMDLDTGDCVALDVPNSVCIEEERSGRVQPPSHSNPISCHDEGYPIMSSPQAEAECDLCMRNSSGCEAVSSQATAIDPYEVTIPSIHCSRRYPDLIFKCPPTSESVGTHCEVDWSYGGRIAGLGGDEWRDKIVLLNSLAIRYDESVNKISIVKEDVENSIEGLYQILSAFVDTEEVTCRGYNSANASDEFQYCAKDKSLKLTTTSGIFNDFNFQGDVIQLCTAYNTPGLKLKLYHYVLIGLSILSVFVYIIVNRARKQMNATTNFITCSMVALVGALVSFSLINVIQSETTACHVIAGLSQYFFLAVQTWTNALAIWMFIGLSRIALVAQQGRSTFLKYSLYAWLLPLMFVAAAVVLHYVQYPPLTPVFSAHICFMAGGWVRLALFTGPIYVLVFVNLIMCIATVTVILRSGRDISRSEKQRRLKSMIIIVKLQATYGIHWVLLYLAEIAGPQQRALWEILTVFVALQGVLVMSVQTLSLDNCRKFTGTVSTVIRTTSMTLSSRASAKIELASSRSSSNGPTYYQVNSVELVSVIPRTDTNSA